MTLSRLKCAVVAPIAMAACAGAANAQQPVSRTSDYTMTWSNSAFGNANADYNVSWAYNSTFSNYSLGFNLVANAKNLAFQQYPGG